MGRHRKQHRPSHRLGRRIALLSAGLLFPGMCGAAVFAATGAPRERAVPSAGSHAASRPKTAMRGMAGARPYATGTRRPTGSVSSAAPAAGTTASPAPTPRITFAPYADVLTWPPLDLAGTAERTGVRDYTLGFVAAGLGCTATWGGLSPIDDPVVRKRIEEVPGEIIVSFGGPHGTELAQNCADVDDLTARYRDVLKATETHRIDFYLTDAALADGASIGRRTRALARLQHDDPRLQVSFTLPLHRSGLAGDALGALRSAATGGLDVSVVDLLPTGGTAQSIIASATAAHGQLQGLYRENPAQTWQHMGVVPVIGVAPTGATFQSPDARQLRDWADAHGLARLSMWSITRDTPCASDITVKNDTCSGLDEDAGVFSKIFQGSPQT